VRVDALELLQLLIHPLEWVQVYVPTIPDDLLSKGLLQNPFPCLLGLRAKQRAALPSPTPEQMVIVDLDAGEIVEIAGVRGLQSRVDNAFEARFDGSGVERRAIMKRDTRPQLRRDREPVCRHVPAGGESWLQCTIGTEEEQVIVEHIVDRTVIGRRVAERRVKPCRLYRDPDRQRSAALSSLRPSLAKASEREGGGTHDQ